MTQEDLFVIDTKGEGFKLKSGEEKTVEHPPKDGFGNKLKIEKIADKQEKKETKEVE
jgi:hypothetical protein